MISLEKKLSEKNARRLCKKHATSEKTLVVHAEDCPFEEYFPNAYTVTKRTNIRADLHVDKFYHGLNQIESESYKIVLCTGLIEHLLDPQRLIDEFYRILKPGGKLILSAAGIFAYHEGPQDFFRFTPFGIKFYFNRWKNVSMRGSCQPFYTIAIMLQRIYFQCKIKFGLKYIIAILCTILPFFDRFIGKQYCTRHPKNRETEIDSILPAKVYVVAIK